MTDNHATNGAHWKLISRAAGLTILAAGIVLLFLKAIAGADVDSLAVETLFVVGAYLCGVPSIASFVSAIRKNGSG